MAAPNYNFPPPGGAPNVNSNASPLRPSYYSNSSLESPLEAYYQHNLSLEYELAAQNDINSQQAAKELLSYGMIKFLTQALAAPFEAGQILLQVQYMPNDDGDETNGRDDDFAEQERRDEEFMRAQEEAEDEEYFSEGAGAGGGYYTNSHRGASFPSPRPATKRLDPSSAIFHERKEFDQSGYLIRTNVYDDDSRPAFQMPPIEGGVWKAITDLAKHPTEGYLSLWKGQYSNWAYEMLHLFAQPTLEATLNDTFDLYDDTIPLVHLDHVGPNIATMVTSHLVVGFILSPLELVRTRLIVQTSDPKQRKYTGMLNCISTIIAEEGFSALWGGVNLWPTVLTHTLTPLFTNLIPLIIDRVFNISAVDSPFLHALAELGLDTLDLLIRMPLETIRRRLQIQIQAKIPGKRYETVVETRKRPYAGMVDCAYKIIQEEGAGAGQKRRISRRRRHEDEDGEDQKYVHRPWYAAWRVRGLYTGLGMHLTSNFAMFAVGAVSSLQDDSDDW
ncbi:hypothetical protein BG011_009373 [Mortierella polycephala]|uniref:Mitochondrial carrier n=1 Tax=Mortierella polycephala TaxID=41804 RepID=A0A9P6PLF5_9FUNG|nr:hypothetical protein BG011_009373 [Mortierella polycephala]